MAEVSRTFTVAAPLEKVVAYLRDFANTEAWDPGTDTCEQATTGPVAVGTEWHNVSSFFGRTTALTYRMTRDDPDHVVFEGRNGTAATSDDLAFEKVDDASTSITYRARLEFTGLARFADPVARLAFEVLAAKTVTQMTGVLEAR
ncbi:SRPBCC family protein [Rhodococcus sp. JVH1]|uniref:SRPBCC family protein n=1 Tax=Rhodococcus sp. JVH1 TaxID=745408 RepID=UPI0002720DEB|nr:SRPBCC family protein [Rhodococcus sp. JVH1]EJI97167.1 carbon monoxide dehydrogenase subunit G family protein [Rhodococcus sp. JVH1]